MSLRLPFQPACGRMAPTVWYPPHPLLRHWLGWMERIDATRWRFRMEPYHIDILPGIPALCEDVAQIAR